MPRPRARASPQPKMISRPTVATRTGCRAGEQVCRWLKSTNTPAISAASTTNSPRARRGPGLDLRAESCLAPSLAARLEHPARHVPRRSGFRLRSSELFRVGVEGPRVRAPGHIAACTRLVTSPL